MANASQVEKPKQQNSDDKRGLKERLSAVVSRLQQDADARVGKRTLVEDRWLLDLQAYHGRYDEKTLKAIEESLGSKLFITQTRTKTNAMEARLVDMLFPTDDKNWGIRPTPVPELADGAKEAVRKAQAMADQATEQQQVAAQQAAAGNQQGAEQSAAKGSMIAQQADEWAKEALRLKGEMDEARRRCEAMSDEIEDQLRECRYQAQARDCIRDACRMGTGVIKGPMVATRMRPRWRKAANVDAIGSDGGAMQGEAYELIPTTDPRPMFYRVDPWNFFPDDVDNMEDCESTFERHMLNKKAMRRLAKQPGFDKEAIRRLLRAEPRYQMPQYMARLRAISGEWHDPGGNNDLFHVWEYHGPLDYEEVCDLAYMLDPTMLDDMDGSEKEEIDPLTEMNVTVWFCDGEVLKFGIHPLDSGESLYSVFNLEKDETSLFGFGVPYMIRDSQKALNGAWRMLMDNAGLSVGPQIVINDSVIEPEDGVYAHGNKKIWLRKQDAPTNQPAFEVYNIDSHADELLAIIAKAEQNIDTESALPNYTQTEMGAHPEPTATGAVIMSNSDNVVFRRIVKNFDDDFTTGNLRRLYDWNMQFSPKDHIKGDYEVDARGTSVLLVREIQAQNLMILLFQGTAHPVVGPWLKVPDLVKKLVQSMMVPSDDVVKSQEEFDKEMAARPPEPNPEMEKLAAQMNLAQLERQTKLEVATMERDTKMMEVAAKMNMTKEQLQAVLAGKQMEVSSKERSQAVEIAVEERNIKRGIAAPSGGNISVESNSRKAAGA